MFIIRWKNKENYKGLDEYLSAGNTGTLDSPKLIRFLTRDDAEQFLHTNAQRHILDEGHEPATIVELSERAIIQRTVKP